MTQFFEPAERLKQIPPYLFKEIDKKKAQVRARGADIIDLGVGDPDLPTPRFIVEKMMAAVQDPGTHRYPAYSGMKGFREAVTRWYKKRFRVKLDPESEVLTLIGSKEGIAHLPLGINDPEDINLMTTPAYPVYQMGTLFAGAYCHFLPLTRENGFLPELTSIPPLVARDAKALFFNYPNNPTAAVAKAAMRSAAMTPRAKRWKVTSRNRNVAAAQATHRRIFPPAQNGGDYTSGAGAAQPALTARATSLRMPPADPGRMREVPWT